MRDTDDANGRPIPQFRPVEFGNRNVECRSQAILQASYYLASIFDRLRGFNVKFEGEKSDGHSVVSRWSLAVGETKLANDQRQTTKDDVLCDHFRRDFYGGEGLDHIVRLD